MSTNTLFSVLALASLVLAGQHGHSQHRRLHGRHQKKDAGAPPYAYPTSNTTEIWGTTGYDSATSVASAVPTSSYASSGDNTYTISNTHSEVVYSTISISAAEQCAAEVTVTNTEKVYVTVTAGQSASSSAQVSAVDSTSAAASYMTPAAYGAASGSTPAASVYDASSSISAAGYSAPLSSAPASSAQASSSSEAAALSIPFVAPVVSSVLSDISTALAASATASAPASYSSSSSSSGKRGLAYNDASLTTCFDGSSEISWAYNWGSDSNGLTGGVTYIPTLWGNADTYTSSWSSNAKSAIESGSTHLFSFNEPDDSGQANMDAATAAAAYKQYMNPFNGQAKLCAPSVTNGPAPMGLAWLSEFLAACDGGCDIDCINIHWYDSATNIDYFKDQLENATSIAAKYNIDTLYLSEFGATGSDDEITTFLETVMPWMDSNDAVAGYAYYMVSDGLLVSSGEPSTYGSTYKTYTS